MRRIGDDITILNTANADVAQNNGTWYNVGQADQLVFDIQITGTATASIDFGFHGNNTATTTSNFNASNTYVLDDPTKQVRGWSNGVGNNESAVIIMQEIFYER